MRVFSAFTARFKRAVLYTKACGAMAPQACCGAPFPPLSARWLPDKPHRAAKIA